MDDGEGCMQQGTSMFTEGWETGARGGWIGMGMRHDLLCSTAADNEVFLMDVVCLYCLAGVGRGPMESIGVGV